MHSLQLVLVEATSQKDAIRRANFELDNAQETGSIAWSDWWQISNDYAPANLGEPEPVIHYASDPEKFNSVLQVWSNYRVNSMKQYYERISEGLDIAQALKDYDPFATPNYKGTTGLYFMHCLADNLLDYWTPDTAVFDLVAYTANLSFFLDRVQEKPDAQYAVLVDFHH